MKKEIIINGVTYPVEFTLLTMSNFEEIAKMGFFEANMNKINIRTAIIEAAVLTADEHSELTIKEIRGNETFEDYKQIVEAFNIVMNMANDFFKIPKVEEDKDQKPTGDGEGVKN